MAVNPEISRIAKVWVDADKGGFAEAEARLLSLTLDVVVSPERAHEPAAQAAVLTAVLTGSRCFPGGVILTGAVEAPLVLPLPHLGATLGEAAFALGATTRPVPAERSILVGEGGSAKAWSVRAWWDGWMAGSQPPAWPDAAGAGGVALAGAAAGALAVGAAFRSACDDRSAGREPERISLWSPGGDDPRGPDHYFLPDAIWLIGLGNLGQAYLWALSLLPYADPAALRLVLQDEDVVKEENWGTSVLVRGRDYGVLKTRIAEDWATRRGFRVRRIDRWLDGATTVRPDSDPPLALSGLDRIRARRLLAPLDFPRIIDCGLGATAAAYAKYRLTVYDPTFGVEPHLQGLDDVDLEAANIGRAGYRDPAVAGCGAAELAGASVAVPFVSAVVAALAVAQATRIACGLSHVRSIVGCLDGLTTPSVVEGPAGGVRGIGRAAPR